MTSFTKESWGIALVALTAISVVVYGASVTLDQSQKTASSPRQQVVSSPQIQIEPMPAELETRFALSAMPPAMRERAAVYLLDPDNGYRAFRHGRSGWTCLVGRTAWEQADFRNDIYVPLCYDAAGTKTYLKVIMDAAALRADGTNPVALKTEIEKRYRNKTYRAPDRAGLSYMIAPVQRTWMLPDGQVHTGSMPHLMFYAPNLTNEDIAGVLSLDPLQAFVFAEGNATQSYIVHLIGEAEKAKIIADENSLLSDLCAYRDILCLSARSH
jgi:hypothetical protein